MKLKQQHLCIHTSKYNFKMISFYYCLSDISVYINARRLMSNFFGIPIRHNHSHDRTYFTIHNHNIIVGVMLDYSIGHTYV